MSNSKYVDVVKLSPNCTKPRNHAIDRITPHHTAGVLSVESALDLFAKSSTQASCNYVIGKDGRVGLCVDEKNRAWTSRSRENDNRAITFECVNSYAGGDWPVSNETFEKLVLMCIDICQRYGKTKLLWIPKKDEALSYQLKDNEMLLTQHNWFANTNCPGAYLSSKFPELAERVTAALNKENEKPMTEMEIAKNWAVENGIYKGYGGGEMGWKDPLTREQMATLLYRFYNKLKDGELK